MVEHIAWNFSPIGLCQTWVATLLGRVSSEDEKRVCSCETRLQHKHIFKNLNCPTREYKVSERAHERSEQCKRTNIASDRVAHLKRDCLWLEVKTPPSFNFLFLHYPLKFQGVSFTIKWYSLVTASKHKGSGHMGSKAPRVLPSHLRRYCNPFFFLYI